MNDAGERWDGLWLNARLATMTEGGAPYGVIDDGAIAVADGRIAWVGLRRRPGDRSPFDGFANLASCAALVNERPVVQRVMAVHCAEIV